MKKYFSIYVLMSLVAAMSAFTACNSDDDNTAFNSIDTSDQSACMIKSFSLDANDAILANLDTVFFSIDLNSGIVFNADSLPLGTRIDSLGVTMTTSSVSKAEIIMPGSNGQDTTVNYLDNTASTGKAINFSRGYVTVHLESANTLATRDYRVYVNVHKMKPDSLAWGETAYSRFPTSLSNPTALKAVKFKGYAVCFASDGAGNATRAVSSNPGLNDWQIVSVNMPATLDVNTLTATEDALYAIDGGILSKSTDEGVTWVSTGTPMSHIYCAFNESIIGVDRHSDNKFYYATYPATTQTRIPDNAPVAGTGSPLTFSTEWSSNPMVFVLGGTTASGENVGSMWAYDGSQWAEVSQRGIPAVSGVTMFPYFFFTVQDDWKVTEKSVLLAFGGRQDDGTLSRPTYISYDLGINWDKAGYLMQLPEDVPSLAGAQALVFEKTLTSSRAAGVWTPVELPRMSGWLAVDNESEIAPITSWDCPYIYLFGGVTESGSVNKNVWRGVINRLTFKPLQ